MKNIKLNISLAFLILLVGLLTTCQKREFSNPWDELAQLKPEAWAPKQLQVQSQHIALNTLSWEFDDKNIQGFRIDRKVGEDDWQEAYASMPKDSRVWLDSLVVPDTNSIYQYRLYAYAGNNSSSKKELTYKPIFEAPTNLQIEKLNDISYELNWQNNTQWPETSQLAQGFKIDRKTADGEWQLAIATLPSNQTSWVDTNVFAGREAIELNYRVYAYYGDLKSAPLQASKETSLSRPSKLTITQNSITSVNLIWQHNNQGEQGFILERSYDAQSWQQLQKNNSTSYTDEDFELNRQVYYRLATYFEEYLSDYATVGFDAQIPSILALDYSINGTSSLTLSWAYPEIGHQGFLVERQLNEAGWEVMATLEATSALNYTDKNIDLIQNDYYYRLSVFVGEQFSDYQNLSFALPQISTHETYAITDYTAFSGGEVISAGSPLLIQKGICWSTQPNPGIDDFITQEGGAAGSFTSEIIGLAPLTTYYVRAYAINAIGVQYGMEQVFTTETYSPTVSTSAIINITSTSATAGGQVSEQGSTSVSQRGLCWSTSSNPDIDDNFTTDGTGVGIFTSEISGLLPSTTYYVRSYAINLAGISYGEELSFVTSNEDDVYNPATGKIWKDKNLGANRVAQSSADDQAYGDLYQWGRGTDGHEKRTSQTTTSLSSTDKPTHGRFILAPVSPYDWRSPKNNDLWQGTAGTNNPCPEGFRVPTSAEWYSELASWTINNAGGAFASPLKLPAGGMRSYDTGTFYNLGEYGYYWSSTVSGTLSLRLEFFSTDAKVEARNRSNGFSVRCIKD